MLGKKYFRETLKERLSRNYPLIEEPGLLVIVIRPSGVQFREQPRESFQSWTGGKREADLKLRARLRLELYHTRPV